MTKIFKYLWECKAAVAAIIVLLILQAYCDLSLPQYTADIVDVGIAQGGIRDVAPSRMRPETMENLCLFLTDEEESKVRAAYLREDDGNYKLASVDKETVEELNESLGEPMLLLSVIEKAEAGGASVPGLEKLRQMMDSGLRSDSGMTKDQLLQAKDEILEAYGELSESMISQMALQFVKDEYTALGMDLGKLQNSYLLHTGGKMLGLSILMMASSILVGLLAARSSAGIGRSLRGRVFHKVVSFSNAEMDRFSTASLITRSTNDIQQIQMVSVVLLRMVLYAPIIGIGGIVKVTGTHTNMGWIIVVAVMSSLLLVGVLMRTTLPKFKRMQALVDRLNLVAREILTGIPVIRAFSREKFEEKRFDKANQDLMSTQLFTNRVMTVMMPGMMLIMNGVTVLIVWFGARGIDLGSMQVGDMLAFITYTMQIIMAFLMLTMVSIMLPRAGVAAGRIDEVLSTESSIADADKPRDGELEGCHGVVAFEEVDFRYPGADENALFQLNFSAEPGKTTAIIGSTGCGKSTLVQLIPRFYDVTGGRITIDGVDIREISQHRLHELIGFVPQKTVLFSGDVESNIKFGGSGITDEAMVEAAQIAQAEEFIESKPDRYGQEISQGGTNVSGGQKQRLSIARAIAKNPKIYIFDDSFSALDYKTDITLRRALGEKVTDATVIIVAQRISTVLHADQIIVLDDGRIAGCGTHEELMAECEEYMEIARSQLSEAELKGGVAG